MSKERLNGLSYYLLERDVK